MQTSPSLLRRTGGTLFDAAAQVRAALTGDRAGTGDPEWATEIEQRAQAGAWDGYLSGLAARLDDAGERLHEAADRYADTDGGAARRLRRTSGAGRREGDAGPVWRDSADA